VLHAIWRRKLHVFNDRAARSGHMVALARLQAEGTMDIEIAERMQVVLEE
jgi:hypothetical protein